MRCLGYQAEQHKLWWCTRLVENKMSNAICVFDLVSHHRVTLPESVNCSKVFCFHVDMFGNMWTGHIDGEVPYKSPYTPLLLPALFSTTMLSKMVRVRVRVTNLSNTSAGNKRGVYTVLGGRYGGCSLHRCSQKLVLEARKSGPLFRGPHQFQPPQIYLSSRALNRKRRE